MKNINKAILITLALLAGNSQATTIAGIEGITLLNSNDSVIKATAGSFYDNAASLWTPGNPPPTAISSTQLKAALTDNETTGPYGDPAANLTAAIGTYVYEYPTNTYIDITFSNTVTNQTGDDLVFFFVGFVNSEQEVVINFDLDINADGVRDATGITPFIPYNSSNELTYVEDLDGSKYTLTAALIDLDDFNFYNGQELNTFRVHLGSNTYPYPSLSAIGHLNTTAIPLPLPVILFASGLGLLGVFGRSKSKK